MKGLKGLRLRVGFLGLWTAMGMALLLSAHGARAGWRLDHYVVSSDSRSRYHSLDEARGREFISSGQEYGGDSAVKHDQVFSARQGMSFFQFGATLLSYVGHNITMSGDSGFVKAQVTPVFKWEGEGEASEEFYIAERSEISVFRTHMPMDGQYDAYTLENPYDGHGFTIVEADNGFKDPLGDWQHVDPYGGDFSPKSYLCAFGTATYHLTVVHKKSATEARGPTRHLWVRATSPGWTLGSTHYNYWPSASCTGFFKYEATVASAAVRLRRHGTTEATAESATIAAGAKAGNEHLADVELNVWAPMQTHYASYALPGAEVKVSARVLFGDGVGGVGGNAKFTRTPGPLYMDEGGRVNLGTVRSSNRTTVVPQQGQPDMRMRVQVPIGSGGPSAVINQVWDQANVWDNGFPTLTPDQTFNSVQSVTFKPQFGGGASNVPITGHKLRFLVTKVLVRGTNPAVGMGSVIFTINPKEADATPVTPFSTGPGGNTPILYRTDLSQYASFPEEDVNDEGNGTYRSQLSVKNGEGSDYFDETGNFNPNAITWVVEKVWYAAEDQETYKP
jgi:hypothetical protein